MRVLAQFVFVRRPYASVCVCVRMRPSASAFVCVRLRLRSYAFVCVCVCVHLSACVLSRVSRRSYCLASVSVCASRVCLRASCLASVCVRLVSRLSQFVRLASVSVCASRVCLSLCVSRLSVCVLRLASVCLLVNACGGLAHFIRRSSFKEFKRSSYYLSPCLLSYNVPMPKYPSHHLIYVFYHPMPIMPLY